MRHRVNKHVPDVGPLCLQQRGDQLKVFVCHRLVPFAGLAGLRVGFGFLGAAAPLGGLGVPSVMNGLGSFVLMVVTSLWLVCGHTCALVLFFSVS